MLRGDLNFTCLWYFATFDIFFYRCSKHNSPTKSPTSTKDPSRCGGKNGKHNHHVPRYKVWAIKNRTSSKVCLLSIKKICNFHSSWYSTKITFPAWLEENCRFFTISIFLSQSLSFIAHTLRTNKSNNKWNGTETTYSTFVVVFHRN